MGSDATRNEAELEKKVEFQLVLWASSYHILLDKGHFSLVLVTDFVRLACTLAHWASQLFNPLSPNIHI